jgi:hypothetical protein
MAQSLAAEIDPYTFPTDTQFGMQKAANDVVMLVQRRISGEPPLRRELPILCYIPPAIWETESTRPPITLTDDPRRVRIAVPASVVPQLGNDGVMRYQHSCAYAQFTYYLGHEFCHVMLDPRRDNGILETLATALSLQVLDDMGEYWHTKPPFTQVKEYWPNFERYKLGEQARCLEKCPDEIKAAINNRDWESVSLYIRYKTNNLNWDRDVQMLAAVRLLAGAVPWKELRALGSHTNPPPNIADGIPNSAVSDFGGSTIGRILLPDWRRVLNRFSCG